MRPASRLFFVVAPLLVALPGCFSGPPQIVSIEPNRGSTGVAADQAITVVFDHAVNRQSVEQRFSVSPSIPNCNVSAAFSASSKASCYVTWLTDRPGFTLFHPHSIFAPLTKYTFQLSSGVVDTTGVANSLTHTWDITTAIAPTISFSSPANNSVKVPVERPLVLGFTNAMTAATTDKAIHLTPAVPGTRVVQNAEDHGRFVVIPGQLLKSNTTYGLTVDTSATDDQGQRLTAPITVHFQTSGMSTDTHAIILAGPKGQKATSVILSALGPEEVGDPVATTTLLQSPTCAVTTGCGVVGEGSPLVSYVSATLSHQGEWLAAVTLDATSATPISTLHVYDIVRNTEIASIPGATLPSWGPESTLAYADGNDVGLFDAQTRKSQTLPSGPALVAPPVWSSNDDTLVLPVTSGSNNVLQLASVGADARYAVPAFSFPASSPTVSPDGSQLAALRSDSGHVGLWIIDLSGSNAPRLVASQLTPVGWIDDGTLLAKSSGLERISSAGGSSTSLSLNLSAASLASLQVAPTGRQLGYVSTNSSGIKQAYVVNSDGTNVIALTTFSPHSSTEVVSISFSA